MKVKRDFQNRKVIAEGFGTYNDERELREFDTHTGHTEVQSVASSNLPNMHV